MAAVDERNTQINIEESNAADTQPKENPVEKNEQTVSEIPTLQSTTEFCPNSTQKKRKRSRAPPGKPPYSYVALITMAIKSSPRRKMTLAEIQKFIAHNFPYYRTCPLKWRNAIRHNLTLNDCFVKLPLQPHDQNRAHYWTLDPASEMMFEDGSYRRRKKRFTRQQHLDEILPSLVERTTVPSYETSPLVVQPIPYRPCASAISHPSTSYHRRGFTIDDILAPSPPPAIVIPPPAIVIPPPTPPQIQFVNRGFQSNVLTPHSGTFWLSTPFVPGRPFSPTT